MAAFLDRLVEWAHVNLLASDEARFYFQRRGCSIEQCRRHKLGFVTDDYDPDPDADPGHNDSCTNRDKRFDWCDTCLFRSWSSIWEEVEGRRVQAVGRKLVGSIILPLTNYGSAIVGLQRRSLIAKDYESFILKRQAEAYFFGTSASIEEIWRTKTATLVEGPFDFLVWERLVSRNCLALLTNNLNRAQTKFLSRFADRVNLCLDLDSAGSQGVRSIIEHNPKLEIHKLIFPKAREKDKDIGDFWVSVGDEAFRKHFASQMRIYA